MIIPKETGGIDHGDLAVENLRQSARAAIYNSNYLEGLSKFAEIFNSKSGDRESKFYLALHCIASGQIEAGRSLLSQVASLSGPNAIFSFLLGDIIPKLIEGAPGRLKDTASPACIIENYNLLELMVSGSQDLAKKGIDPRYIPILVSFNGDPMWFWGDQIKFIWHVITKPFQSAIPQCQAETDHYVWVKNRISPGDTVLDVGSNLGLFTTMMSKMVGATGRVHAFEPNPSVLDDLRRIIKLNELSNVSVHEVAASDRSGIAKFINVATLDVTRESSRLETSDPKLNEERGVQSILVTTVMLDSYLESLSIRPSLIKMDIEGAEIQALNGLKSTLTLCRPKMVIEYHAGSGGAFDHEWMGNFLRQHKYRYTTDYKNYFCEPE